MDKKPPPQVLFNFQEDDIPESEPPLKLELKDDSEDAEEDFESYEDEIIKIEEKEKPNEKDIFEDIPDSLSSPVTQYEEIPAPKEQVPAPAPAPKKQTKAKKPRKPMSEEHKKKLALAREKAMAVRKANAEEKKKMKALDNEEKELLKKQRFKKVKKLKEEVEDEDESKQVKVSNSVSGITKKDLEEAQLEAIMKYEAIRKERKAKKKQEQIIEEGKKKMLNNIQRATGQYSYRDGSNRFDSCY